MKRIILTGLVSSVFIFCSTINAEDSKVKLPKDRIEVYYLHNTFRCLSCNTIENLIKAAIYGGKAENQKYKTEIDVKPAYKKQTDKKALIFKAVNIDEEENKHLLKDLKAKAKYPVIVLIKDNKVTQSKVLEKAWDLMNDNQKFIDYIRKNVNEFIKQTNGK